MVFSEQFFSERFLGGGKVVAIRVYPSVIRDGGGGSGLKKKKNLACFFCQD